MKSYFTLITFILSISAISVAQVTEESRQMINGLQNALILEISNADNKLVDKEWRAFTKDYGRLKKVKKSSEFMIDDAQLVDVGGVERVDIYSKIESVGNNGGRLVAWFNLGDNYVGSDALPEAYAGAVKFLQRFDHHMKVRKVEIELVEEEKEMKKLDSSMAKLQKNNENYNKEIDKCNEKISQMEDNIVKNLEDQELAQKEIEVKAAIVNAVKERLQEIRNQGGGN